MSRGFIVSGALISRSILFAMVRVGDGSLVEGSVVLPNVVIGRCVVLKRAIVDKRCEFPDGFTDGVSSEDVRARFRVTARGIVLIPAEVLEQRVPGATSRCAVVTGRRRCRGGPCACMYPRTGF